MNGESEKGWLTRFRAKNYQLALKICDFRWFRSYFFIVAALIFLRVAAVENNPHLFGWLLRIPDFVIQIFIWTAVYPWITLFVTPKNARSLDETSRD